MLVNTPLGYVLFGTMCVCMIGFIYENNKFLKNQKKYGFKEAYKRLISEGILIRMLMWFCGVLGSCIIAIGLSS